MVLLRNKILKLLELSKFKELNLALGILSLNWLAMKNTIKLLNSLQLVDFILNKLRSVFQISVRLYLLIVMIHEILQKFIIEHVALQRLISLYLANVLLDVFHFKPLPFSEKAVWFEFIFIDSNALICSLFQNLILQNVYFGHVK